MGRERRITPEQRFYTGRLHESKWLGEVDAGDAMVREMQQYKKPSKNPKFEFWINFDDSLKLVKKFQPIDKTDPEKKRVDAANPEAPLLRDVKEALIDQMNLTDKQADNLKLYTAVGSPMDVFHGADAIIEYDGKVVTIDLTLKPVDEGKKADVVVAGDLPAPDDPETEDAYLQRVDDIAASVKTILKVAEKRGPRPIQRLYPPSEAA